MRQRSISSFIRTSVLRSVGLASLLFGPSMGCVVDDDAGNDGGGASANNVRSCKDACDQLKFFDCNNASEHASCFAACEQADDSAIELFVSCVQTDVCDPDCIDGLISEAGPPNNDGDGDGNGDGDGDGGEGGSCVDACNDFVDAGCLESIDCAAVCSVLSTDERNFVVYCEARRMGCNLPEECEGAFEDDNNNGDPSVACQEGCDSMHFFDCLTAEQHADCRSLCTTVDADTRDTFAACAESGICSDSSCYDVMAG